MPRLHTHSRVGTGLYHNSVCFGLLAEAWNYVMLSRPKANAKLLLHKEKAEYGGEIIIQCRNLKIL